MAHTQGTLAYMFLLFWFPFVPLPASPPFLLVFTVRHFFFHFDDLQLVDVFLPSVLSISIPSRICTDIAFLILRAVVAATCHFVWTRPQSEPGTLVLPLNNGHAYLKSAKIGTSLGLKGEPWRYGVTIEQYSINGHTRPSSRPA